MSDTGTIRVREFYLRRFLRLAPALLGMLVAYAIAAPYLWPEANYLADAALAAIYATSYSQAFWDTPAAIGHTWSLSVEEHFYLLWPLALLALHRNYQGRRLVIVLVGIFLAATAWRLAWINRGEGWTEIYYRSDTRMTGMFLGAALAAAYAHRPSWEAIARRRHLLYLMPIASIMLLDNKWRSVWMLQFGITIVELAAAVLIVGVMCRDGWLQQILSSRWLVEIGKLSYGIYLWHYPVMFYLRTEHGWLVTLTLGSIFALAAAWISSRTIERAGRALRNRLYPAPQNQAGVTGPML